jgi:hypothetical protein
LDAVWRIVERLQPDWLKSDPSPLRASLIHHWNLFPGLLAGFEKPQWPDFECSLWN